MAALVFAIMACVVISVPWAYGFFSMIRDVCRKIKWLKEIDT